MKLFVLGVAGALGLGLFASQAIATTLKPATKPEAAREAKVAHTRKCERLCEREQRHAARKGAMADKARGPRVQGEDGLRRRVEGDYARRKTRQTEEAVRKGMDPARGMVHTCPVMQR